MELIDRPLVHPRRKVTGFRPIKAMRHFGKLVADKEDTEQVFQIIDALKGRKSVWQMADFIATPQARMLLERGEALPPLLDDHARWAKCAPNSLARRYVEFMEREGLTAAGLVAESHKFKPKDERFEDLYEWYIERLRDTHDLFHVLTGYGRDPLGELCLLGFSYEQNHSPGVLFIAWMGARQMAKETGMRAPVMEALAEGRRLGREADKLAHADLLTTLPDDIDAVRARLKIGKPEAYRQCLRLFEDLPTREGGWQVQLPESQARAA
ncbi:Coq4 family protein [Altererythrobacter sp. H2]|uniref:Coq4 family protein n=1 Tax=Altererythrobacter sp. H2 TaxID=3108391 RepID=UPI002B4BB19C|nr:Coq4 family protein [Altererythrobacter sp. H2]WRK94833.1 Coq4 family protein [Altererythrobacter sp. H2]